jgi:hypothetical protein
MKRLLSIILLPVIVGLACARSNITASPTDIVAASTAAPAYATAVTPPVPSEYQAIYDDLKSTLDAFIKDVPPDKGGPLMIGAELLYANSNAGEALLKPEALTAVEQELDALHTLGIKGVVVAIKFPMLEPDFPHSADYLQFYKQVSAEIHKRGMKFLVEAGPAFSGTIFSPLQVDWSKYPRDAFIMDQQNELVTITRKIQPDYLQIANEPDTIAMLSGIKFSPADYAAFVQSSVQKIGHHAGMKLGAGAGTWDDPAYMDDLMNIPGLDCIDIHVYPLGLKAILLQRAYAAARTAHSSGKCAVISEAWSYKISSGETATMGRNFQQVIARDPFSFWEPVDESFIRAVTKLSQASGIEFVSLFWSRYFFAYLDYDQYHNLSPAQINQQATRASIINTQRRTLSPLGVFLRNWLTGGLK